MCGGGGAELNSAFSACISASRILDSCPRICWPSLWFAGLTGINPNPCSFQIITFPYPTVTTDVYSWYRRFFSLLLCRHNEIFQNSSGNPHNDWVKYFGYLPYIRKVREKPLLSSLSEKVLANPKQSAEWHLTGHLGAKRGAAGTNNKLSVYHQGLLPTGTCLSVVYLHNRGQQC